MNGAVALRALPQVGSRKGLLGKNGVSGGAKRLALACERQDAHRRGVHYQDQGAKATN
jgi:hypothetical protein